MPICIVIGAFVFLNKALTVSQRRDSLGRNNVLRPEGVLSTIATFHVHLLGEGARKSGRENNRVRKGRANAEKICARIMSAFCKAQNKRSSNALHRRGADV